jgi:hypothetical protein
LKAYLKSAVERRFYDLGRINYWGQGKVDFGFDESKVTSKEELVRMKSKREIQHIRHEEIVGASSCSPHPPLPIIEMAGHELPADEFISPKRSTLKVTAGVGPAPEGGIKAC